MIRTICPSDTVVLEMKDASYGRLFFAGYLRQLFYRAGCTRRAFFHWQNFGKFADSQLRKLMLKFIFSKIDRKYDRAPLGQDKSAEHARNIKVGDIVEYAVLFSQNIRYRVEEVYPTEAEAKIRLINADGSDTQTTYRAPMQMLRLPHRHGSK